MDRFAFLIEGTSYKAIYETNQFIRQIVRQMIFEEPGVVAKEPRVAYEPGGC